ncbi:DUF927 domain-containing protein [Kitasatospora sp. NPDC093550]|uniref:DUF927 domain-containing protein n=1 Tax=Kitasatospora sp. NPDC093550 TaxID=3364089 RepID=UPI0037F234A8
MTSIRPGVSTAGLLPIAGMKSGWFFDPATRQILHQAKAGAELLPVGDVPPVRGRVTYRMSDRSHTRIGFLLESKEGRRRIATTSEIHDGSYADKIGEPRPVGPDQRQAFAQVMSEEVKTAPELAGIAVKTENGTLVLPDPDAQEYGYLRLGDPDEKGARAAWDTVLRSAMASERTTLVIGAVFAGPLVSSLPGVHAHVLNHLGSPQQGKSLVQIVQACLLGDPSDAGMLFKELSSTANALPELLLLVRYLPMIREEISSGGLTLAQIRALVSRIIGGGRRDRISVEGAVRFQVGAWKSVLSTSSNESLFHPGQPESWASRVIEVHAPFFASGADAQQAAELATQFHGWPLHWANATGQFSGEKIAEWRALHLQITQRLSGADGGVALTLARTVAAWCVGAHLLGVVLGIPELGERAFEDARAELPRIVDAAVENNQPPGAVLWEKLAGLIGTEPLCWPDYRQLGPKTGGDDELPIRTLLGYWYDGKQGLEVHVLKTTMDTLAKQAGIDTTTPGLTEMRKLGILRSTQGATKFTSKPPGEHLRKQVPGMVYILNVDKARALYNEAAEATVLPPVEPPAEDSPIARAELAAANGPAAGTAFTAPALPVVPAQAAADPVAAVVPPRPELPPRIVFPAPERAVVDGRWDTLEKAGGRTADAAALGVLGADGLHLPNCAPVAVELPESVDQVVPLMDAYGLKTLYLHATALRALGLPGYDRRKPGGRTAPAVHPWATPSEGGPVLRVVQGGLVPWMTLETGDGRRLNLAIPEYEDRMDKGVRHGFSGPTEAAVLLDALMVYLLSTLHGTAGKPKVVPYYMSPNKTGEDYAGGLYRDDVTSQAVRRGEVKPLGLNLPSVLKLNWDRQPSAAERDAKWLHQFDKSAAWLAAWGNTPLGIGEPEHYLAERDGALPEIPRDTPGLWRVSNPPGPGIPGLPDFRFEPADEGGFWVRSTPALKVVWDVYPDWVPDVLEAYYWPEKKRALHGAYELLSRGRVRILADLEAGRPGAEWALAVNGSVYKSFRGYLERKKPKRDHVTGEIYERDIYWRPDWAWALMDAALAATFYNVRKFADEDGMFPLTVYVDAVTYASDEADPLAARPTSMKLGRTGGGWKPEGSAPMAELLPLIDGDQDQPGLDARNALREYLRGER